MIFWELGLKINAAAILLALTLTPCALFAKDSKLTLRQQLVGTWKLLSIQAEYPDGRLDSDPDLGPRAAGYLFYDASGHMCAQVMNPDRFDWRNPPRATPAEAKAAIDGYDAYCGRYEVQESESLVIHHRELALIPNEAGTSAQRHVSFAGSHLIFKVIEKARNGQPLKYTLTWERVK
jgi:lipocalin-like protein